LLSFAFPPRRIVDICVYPRLPSEKEPQMNAEKRGEECEGRRCFAAHDLFLMRRGERGGGRANNNRNRYWYY
jgi:hypothetical protein